MDLIVHLFVFAIAFARSRAAKMEFAVMNRCSGRPAWSNPWIRYSAAESCGMMFSDQVLVLCGTVHTHPTFSHKAVRRRSLDDLARSGTAWPHPSLMSLRRASCNRNHSGNKTSHEDEESA